MQNESPAQQYHFFRCQSCGFSGEITMEEIAIHRSRCAYGTTEPDSAAQQSEERHMPTMKPESIFTIWFEETFKDSKPTSQDAVLAKAAFLSGWEARETIHPLCRAPSIPTETREPHSINCIHCPHVLQYHLSGVLEGTKRGCTQCDCPGFETREPIPEVEPYTSGGNETYEQWAERIIENLANALRISRSETREKVLEDALRSALEEYDSRKEDIMTMDYAYAIAEDTINKVRDALERKG